MTNSEIRQAALNLYTPPFKYHMGYIFDADDNMVADDIEEGALVRIRGWGRILYKENAEALQDEVGVMIAEAMTLYWENMTKTQI